MRIESIKLTNFRSIKNCNVKISNITALVGENNSGKSALLRALNSFFNYDEEETDFIKNYHQYTPKSLPAVEIVFDKAPNNSELHQYVRGEKLTLRMRYNPKTRKSIFSYKGDSQKYSPINENTILELKRHINYVFIPPSRDLSRIQLLERNVLKELIETYLARATTYRDTITPKFRDAASNLENNALKKIAKDISSFYILRHKFNYQIKFNEDLNYKDFLREINFLINECGSSHQLHNCGTGIQSLTIIALYRLLSSLQHKNIILGIEEPETNLHPQAQRELIYSLKDSIGQGNLSQAIVTTHAPVIIDQIDHTQVVLFRKVDDAKRAFRTDVTSIPNSFLSSYNLDELKYNQFYSYRNSDFFYAKFVIIVESTVDAEVVKYLLKKNDINLEVYGVSIVNLDGVRNLKYPLFLIRELKIPYLVIVDKDFFLPYLHDELKKSRDSHGLPKYRYEFKENSLIQELVPNAKNRIQLLKLFRTNHSKALNLLENYNIVCMKHSLEIDLIGSCTAENEFYNHLSVPQQERNKTELLVNRYKQIKRLDNIIPVLSKMENKNLPNSYKRIKKVISTFIKKM